MDDAEQFDRDVLLALTEGFQARAGAKERFQALSEYELARRLGIQDYSYVEYDTSPEHGRVRSALSRLQRQGLVRAAGVSGRYETFAPTTTAEFAAGQPEVVDQSASSPDEPGNTADRPIMPATFEGRLEEIIRLLRSIDQRLARIERSWWIKR